MAHLVEAAHLPSPGCMICDAIIWFAESESAWEESKAAAGCALLKLGNADIRLKYSPLQLTVDIAGKPAIIFNGRHMFNLEHLRQKKVVL